MAGADASVASFFQNPHHYKMQFLFGRKRTEVPSEVPRLAPTGLPVQFAEEVIDLEGELRLRCSLNLVKRLTELYTQAIEHYAKEENEKYLHYIAGVGFIAIGAYTLATA